MFNLYPIDAGFFKLDGGAMYGVVPKSLWAKKHPPDEHNLCTWALRSLLIETKEKCILIDTGIGDKQPKTFLNYFSPSGPTLSASLEKQGFTTSDITDVLLTHLHFDHVGGAVYRDAQGNLHPTFPKATHWCTEDQWNWANNPNVREKAAFLPENFILLKEANLLNFVRKKTSIIPEMELWQVDGHTKGMLIPIIQWGTQKVAFMADLIPSVNHIGMPYIMAYDVNPLFTLKEKSLFLNRAIDENILLFFQHDPQYVCAFVKKTNKGIVLERIVDFEKIHTT